MPDETTKEIQETIPLQEKKAAVPYKDDELFNDDTGRLTRSDVDKLQAEQGKTTMLRDINLGIQKTWRSLELLNLILIIGLVLFFGSKVTTIFKVEGVTPGGAAETIFLGLITAIAVRIGWLSPDTKLKLKEVVDDIKDRVTSTGR